jgi:acyl-CoA reductase-like NAD-dependent aldehyde dehydrogenase
MLLHERDIKRIVEQVIGNLEGSPTTVKRVGAPPSNAASGGHDTEKGIYGDVDHAVAHATEASEELSRLPVSKRAAIIEHMRKAVLDNLSSLAQLACNETGMGRAEDKILKNRLVAEKTPGTEDLTTWAKSGDHGISLEELAPYGVIGAVIPSTNPTETVVNNGISMFAGGNAVVFNPHPMARQCSLFAISLLNGVVESEGGPPDCFTAVARPSIDTAEALMRHARVPVLAVTGSEGVVKAAMQSGKRVIAAGPGNPPAVVDETADIAKAAKNIVSGGSLDNNIVCIAEKVTIVVESVADRLVAEMEQAGAYRASPKETRRLIDVTFAEPAQPNRQTAVNRRLVGRNASEILHAAGILADGDPRLIVCEVSSDHPFAWTEMLMPIMPLVRVSDVDAAIDYAVQVEQRCRHTATMHSRNIDKLMEMGRRINCSVYVKNGPSFAGIGLGGEGHTSDRKSVV